MTKKPIAIVLGGTTPHIALIDNLKNKGFYTILIDYYQNPPAKPYADFHLVESTLDQELVLRIAKKYHAAIVISTCIDQANMTACYVAEKLGLPSPYSYETAKTVTNKGLMKQIMVDNDVPTSKHFFLSNHGELSKTDLKFPIVVKPVDSTGSKGVRIVDDFRDLKEYLALAVRESRTGKAIVEEFSPGIEVQIDCFIKDGIAEIIMLRQKIKMEYKKGMVLQSLGSIIPVKISSEAEDNIKKTANLIAFSFNLNDTPLFIQAIINENDVSVIEFAPRIGGGLSYSILKKIAGFDVIDAAVDSFLGISPNLKYRNPTYYYATILLYTEPGIFSHFEGEDIFLEQELIDEFYYLKPKGTEIGSDISSNNRVGAFLSKAESRDTLIKNIKDALNEIEVYNIKGKRFLREDLYANLIL